jgi:adenine-specific DNA-methyltransferase
MRRSIYGYSRMQTHGVKYIGSKMSLLKFIVESIDKRLNFPKDLRIIDVFTGTTRVAQAFRGKGWSVQSSDLSWAAEAYAEAFLKRTAESGRRIPQLITSLQDLQPRTGWITRNYCDVSGSTGGLVRMWTPANGRKADAIRDKIAEWEASQQINRHEAMILVCCLIFALDRVDNSVGIQQAYLKDWAKRTADPLRLVDLGLVEGHVASHQIGNCLNLTYQPADVAYLDPPYSAHSYSTYYHIWDSITRWDKPAVSLTTNRRIDRVASSTEFDESMVSPWNSGRTALEAFVKLCRNLPVRYIVVSYNNESIIPMKTLVERLEKEFGTAAISKEDCNYKRNIMSQIGNATLYKDEFKTKNVESLIWIQKSPL